MTCNPPELVDLASEEEDETGDDVKDDVVDDDDSDDEVEMLDVVLGTEKPPEEAAAVKREEEAVSVKAESDQAKEEEKEVDDDEVEVVGECSTTAAEEESSPEATEDDFALGSSIFDTSIDESDDDRGLDPDERRTKIFVKYLPQQFQCNNLQHLFNMFGPIRDAKVMRDEATDAPKGWGFVDFEEAEDAAKAIRKMHGRQFGDKTLEVTYFESDLEPRAAVRVTSSVAMLEDSLHEWFSQFGHIVRLRLLDHQKTAFVLFKMSTSAREAVAELNGSKDLNGSALRVELHEHKNQKLKFQFYKNFLERGEDDVVYRKLREKKLIPSNFPCSSARGVSVKDRLGPVRHNFKRPKNVLSSKAGMKQGQRSKSVERLVRDKDGKIVPIFRSEFRQRTSSI